MWKALVLLAILANLLIVVSSNPSDKGKVKDKHTIITTITKADSNADASADSGNGTASAGAGAAASVTTIVKTHVHTMKKCASHEKYVKCPKKLCTPQNCEEVGVLVCSKEKHIHEQEEKEFHEDKEKHARECGSPACFCKDDYVRIHGICRPIAECDECGDDKNATVGCGVNCGKRCSNYMNKNISCPDTDYVCYENSCDCKKDYVFDDNTGKCVLPEDCSNKNAPNPKDGQGTPGDGEPENNSEGPCDGCNGDCAVEETEDGSSDAESRQKQCSTKDFKTTEKENETSTKNNNESSEETETTTIQSEDSEDTSLKVTGKEDTSTEGTKMSESIETKNTEESITKTDEPEDATEAPENKSKITNEDGNSEKSLCSGDPNAMPGCDKECKKRCPGDKADNCKCLENSCECKEGYVYSSTTYKCIKPTECGSKEESKMGSATEESENTKTTATITKSSGGDTTNQACSEKNITSTIKKVTIEPKTTTSTSNEDICPEETKTSSSMSDKSNSDSKTTTSQSEDSENESETTTTTTEESAKEFITKKKHKHEKHESTTVSPCQGINSESKMTSEEFENTSKKHKNKNPKTTTSAPDEAMNSEEPEEEASETTSTESHMSSGNMTHKKTKMPETTTNQHRTTTMNSESGTSISTKPKKSSNTTMDESVMKSTTRRIRRTRKPSSKEEEDQSKSTKEMGEESETTTATDECNGRHERNYKCASACPDNTCSDFLTHNITRCNKRQGSNCKPGCRCRNGYYRDMEGKCVSGAFCRQQARSTSTTTSGTTKGSELMTNNDENCEEEALWPFIKANLRFTAKILAELSSQNEDRNVLLSGSTVLFLLAQLALFANGDSQKQLLGVLDLNTEQIQCLFPQLNKNFTVEFTGVEYDLFCNIIADDSCLLTEKFKNTIEDIFHTPPQNVNFTDEQSAVTLSDRVANFTGLQNFVTSKVLSSLSSLVLTDVQVFKGEWMKMFDPKKTTELDFHGSNDRLVKKPMMHQYNKFLYTESESLDCKVLKMKYRGGDFTFAIFLPNSENGINDLINKLSNIDDVVSTLNSLRLKDVEVYVPKFKQTSSNRLKDYTTMVNIDIIYNADSAGLQGVTSCDKAYVSDILQKLSIVVDETGYGKSDSVESYSNEKGPSNPHQHPNMLTFKADHPFVYYVFYRKIVILSGTYVI